MFCSNCRKPIKTNATGMPYCGCRIYSNSKPLSYVLIKTVNRKIFIRQSLWVVAQGGTVGLINDSVEIVIRREAEAISVTFNGERLGRAEYVSLPPFVEKLLSSKSEVVRRKQVTVITRREEAMAVLSSTPGAKLQAVENGKATITIPI
jgi:hypothetical protein